MARAAPRRPDRWFGSPLLGGGGGLHEGDIGSGFLPRVQPFCCETNLGYTNARDTVRIVDKRVPRGSGARCPEKSLQDLRADH